MDHIAKFRVMNPHLFIIHVTCDDSQINILQLQTFHNGSLNQRHIPKRGQIIKTLFRRWLQRYILISEYSY